MGTNGIDSIKNHPWFEEIDFGLLEAKYLDPPFVPNLDEVNADCLRHISRPPQDNRFKSIKITPAFEAKLSQFPYVSKKAVQEEIVEVLERSEGIVNNSESHIQEVHPDGRLCCVCS